jgi:hypothetical protein
MIYVNAIHVRCRVINMFTSLYAGIGTGFLIVEHQ